MTPREIPRPNPDDAGRRFPQRKAFVLQFTADAGPENGLFHGKIEHVASGTQVDFQSTTELWAFVRDVLTRTNQEQAALPVGQSASPAQPVR